MLPPSGQTSLPLFRVPFDVEEFLNDIQKLAAILDEQFLKTIQKLEQLDGFAGLGKIATVVCDLPEDQRVAFTRLITNLGRMRREYDCTADDLVEGLQEYIRSALAETFPEERLKSLIERLRNVAQKYPALERQAKAESLATAVGPPVRDVKIICDLRPVFDEPRNQIEGFVPITTLRISYGRSATFEVQLSPLQLTRLSVEVERAQKKLRSLEDLAQRKNLALLEMTEDQ